MGYKILRPISIIVLFFLDNIEKAKTEAEAEEEVEKTKIFLEKTKPPSRHTPLDPDKTPRRLKKLKHIKTSWLKKLEDLLIPSAYAAEPPLQISEQVKTDIQNAIHSGWEAIAPESNLTVGDWIGVGYILQNPENGEAYYRVEGGHGGAVFVYVAYINDLIITALSDFASNSIIGAIKQEHCFPGKDNWLHTIDDTCYTSVSLYEACSVDRENCLYKYDVSHPEFARPLIYILEHGPNGGEKYLTKHIQAKHWQSQDGASYMRVGYAVLTTIEFMLDYFKATDPNLLAGSGYRTKTRNSSVGGAPRSHHPDGVAADVTLTGGPKPPRKCDVLDLAEYLIMGKGESLAEKPKDDGTPKTSVHIAIPGKAYSDRADYPKQWKCQ